ncbi:enoyl-CoA hydratase [Celeribacter neptunius]|uniref:enoyl-CoA hydratase n=1 Tax=Celeribacter neptunius TaxID=588602 RepID=A0A1I3STL7_9RHOB|nr:enoyl-CoA hydratase [Celeribacter neptunius]SFJ62128.1 enoyl-CoA hydratase [Celeribacter neptunius]
MAYKTLLIEIKDNVELVRLNRPEALNALNSELLAELADALTKADADPKVRAIVLTGSDKAFAAGADIKEMSDKSYADIVTENLFADDADRITATRKPVIAAVAGYALGGGCELAMLCDFILAADNVKFGQPEINLGIIPGIGGTQRLTRFVGKSKAMEMTLTGRFMEAEEAERIGLVSRIVPSKKLIEEALSVAGKIAEKSMISVAAAKEAVNRSYETTLSEGVRFERRTFQALFATDDQKEGMAAFLEKREPQFRDK